MNYYKILIHFKTGDYLLLASQGHDKYEAMQEVEKCYDSLLDKSKTRSTVISVGEYISLQRDQYKLD